MWPEYDFKCGLNLTDFVGNSCHPKTPGHGRECLNCGFWHYFPRSAESVESGEEFQKQKNLWRVALFQHFRRTTLCQKAPKVMEGCTLPASLMRFGELEALMAMRTQSIQHRGQQKTQSLGKVIFCIIKGHHRAFPGADGSWALTGPLFLSRFFPLFSKSLFWGFCG